MTVAVGLVCADGVIVASDSMSSDGPTAMFGQKVNALGQLQIVWTASGSVYVIEEVEAALNTLAETAAAQPVVHATYTTPRLDLIRQNVGGSARNAMRNAYATALPHGPNQGNPQTGSHAFASSFLVLGFANDTPYFLEVAHDGQLNWHTARKFYAIGSGGHFAMVAQGIMAHLVEDELDVELGKLVAYRTIETTCRVSSQFVGLPVQMAVVTGGGAAVLTEDELNAVATSVERWQQIERETLSTLFAGPTSEAEEPDAIPTLDDSGG
jgi:20S proteasome alpha/beta subunit